MTVDSASIVSQLLEKSTPRKLAQSCRAFPIMLDVLKLLPENLATPYLLSGKFLELDLRHVKREDLPGWAVEKECDSGEIKLAKALLDTGTLNFYDALNTIQTTVICEKLEKEVFKRLREITKKMQPKKSKNSSDIASDNETHSASVNIEGSSGMVNAIQQVDYLVKNYARTLDNYNSVIERNINALSAFQRRDFLMVFPVPIDSPKHSLLESLSYSLNDFQAIPVHYFSNNANLCRVLITKTINNVQEKTLIPIHSIFSLLNSLVD